MYRTRTNLQNSSQSARNESNILLEEISNARCSIDPFFILSFTTKLTIAGTSSDLGENTGHQLIKVSLTKLSIFMHSHKFPLSRRITLSYEKQFLHAKYVPSRCLRFTKSFSTVNFLWSRSGKTKKKDCQYKNYNKLTTELESYLKRYLSLEKREYPRYRL